MSINVKTLKTGPSSPEKDHRNRNDEKNIILQEKNAKDKRGLATDAIKPKYHSVHDGYHPPKYQTPKPGQCKDQN